MTYKAKVSKTANGIKEKKSVLFIENLLVDASAKTQIETEDTGANIDGYIELLDEEYQIKGKVTVQVKTVSKSDENKNRYPCPTSLFAYAEATTDIVMLIAVDHSQNVALWKFISRPLLEQHRNKENQETITLHFSDNEKLSASSLNETLASWRSISQREVKINRESTALGDENEKLRQYLRDFQNPIFSIVKEDIIKIQQFSDAYNNLLDREFGYIKETIFPKCWKRGLVIYKYDPKELIYSLFDIKFGENSLLIKELPENTLKNSPHDFISMNCASNAINDNPNLLAIKLTQEHVNKFIKQQRIIPSNDMFVLEYVYDFCLHSNPELHIDDTMLENLPQLIEYLKQKYPRITSSVSYIIGGHKNINIKTLFDSLIFLENRGYRKVHPVYPKRANYADSGWVSDWYTSELAFQKLQTVVKTTYEAYSDFINNNFTLLREELDYYEGANIILIIMEYISGDMPSINIFYLRNLDCDETKKIVISMKEESLILEQNNVDEFFKLYNLPSISYQGKSYELFKSKGVDTHKYLFDRYNFLSVFYDILEDRMKEYFESTLKQEYFV